MAEKRDPKDLSGERWLRGALPVIFGGILTGLATLVASTSFAALIFGGELAPFVARGIGIALFTAVVAGIAVSLLSSCTRAIAIPQDRITPVLATMAAGIVAMLSGSKAPEEVFATVAVAIAISTLLTGVFLAAMGLFRFGRLIRFLPHSVVGGFLAGTGWLLLLGGLRVMTASPLNGTSQIATLADPATLLQWLPGIGIAFLILFAARWLKHAVALPLVLTAATAGFYGIALAAGVSLDELAADGWLLGPFDAHGRLWQPLTPAEIARVDWSAILSSKASLGSILLLSAVSLLLTVGALELMVRRDLDVNRELGVAGLANLISGLGGGMVAFHSLSFSALAVSLGTRSRYVGLISALVCTGALLAGPEPLGYLPRIVLGGLLAFLGLSFLLEWLVKTWARWPRSEYAVVVLIVIAMAGFGVLAGMAAGLLLAIILFVINQSSTDVVRYAVPGSGRRSTVERHPAEERFLREHGGRIHLIKVQGSLFFGTIRKLQDRIQERVGNSDPEPLQYAVLDFTRVTGIDPSAVYGLVKIIQLGEQRGFEVILTHVGEGFRGQLQATSGDQTDLQSLRFFPDLDHGLEWCEDRILGRLDQAALEAAPTILDQIRLRLGSDTRRAVFQGYLEAIRLPPGHALIEQGDVVSDLFFVETGTVSVYMVTKSGTRVRLRRTGPGTVIGELGFYLRGPRAATVTTDCAASVYRLRAEALARMEQEAPENAMVFHRFMMEMTADRLLLTTNLVEATSD